MGCKMLKRRSKEFPEKLRYQRWALPNLHGTNLHGHAVWSLAIVPREATGLQFCWNSGGDKGPADCVVKRGMAVYAACTFNARQTMSPSVIDMVPTTATAIHICKDQQSNVGVMVEGQKTMQIEKLLRERDIRYEITLQDTTSFFGSLQRPRSPTGSLLRHRSPTKTVMDWKDFYPLHAVYAYLSYLEAQFPSLCTVSIIGKSVEGRDIRLLKISNSVATNTAIWLDGTIHAREWISTSVVTYIADYIARNFDKLPESMTNKDWYFLPVVNPDGYYYTHLGDRMWRKNRAKHGKNITGVDLNRNFGHNWGRPGSSCSSANPNHMNYRGPEMFSEPESCAIKDFILYSGTPFKIFLTFHAYSEVITFPWCYTSDPCMDYVNLLEGGTAMAKAIYETNGHMYKVGNFKDVMYHASGTSIDWSYGTARIPFSYLVELRSKQYHFTLPKGEILDCCREILNGVKALVDFVEKKKCMNCTIFTNNRKTFV